MVAMLLARHASSEEASWQEEEAPWQEEEAPWQKEGWNLRAWDGEVQWDDDVAVLNGRNFESVVERAPHVLVEFFAPWCGHCQKFEPVYQKVASHLRMERVNVMLAKVNAIEEPKLAQSVGVMGFPSLYWYAYGRMRRYEGGKRNSSMVEWVSFHARRDAVQVVHSNREAEELLEAMQAEEAVIGRFLHQHSVEATAFMIAAEEDDTAYPNSSLPYVMVLEPRGLGVARLGSLPSEERREGEVQGPAMGPSILLRRSRAAGGGTVVLGRWYQPPRWHEQPPERRYALFDADRIKSFVGTWRMPRVVELTGRVWRRVLQSPVRNQTLLFSDPDSPAHELRMAAFAAVAEEWFGKVLFLQISSNFTSVLKYFGLTVSDFPAVVVAVAGQEETDKGEMYRLDQRLPQYNLTSIAMASSSSSSSSSSQTCLKSRTCQGGAIPAMARVIRSFVLSAFTGEQSEFELPKESLEEDVIYPDDPVRKLTAEELQQVVLDSSKDVLVKFFAPWCGHCQAMRGAYMEVSDAFEEQPDVLIAEFDVTAHQLPAAFSVEGFPTLRLWPALRPDAPSSQRNSIDYQGPRTAADISAFVRRHSVRLQMAKEMEERVKALEEEMLQAASDEKFEEAAKLRDEIESLRKELASKALTTVGEKKEKNRKPIFGKRILMEALRQSQQHKQGSSSSSS
eukprot:768471-Hanusia_phi.AAC.3